MTLKELHELGRRDPVAGWYAARKHPECTEGMFSGPLGPDCETYVTMDVPASDGYNELVIWPPEETRRGLLPDGPITDEESPS